MNRHLSRRAIVKTTAFGVLAIALNWSSSAVAEGSLVVNSYGGSFEEFMRGEIVPPFAEQSGAEITLDVNLGKGWLANLRAAGVDNVAVIAGPLVEGDARHGPYDVIVVEGAVQRIPFPILDQIKDGGRIVAIFDGNNLGTVRVGYRVGADVDWRAAFDATATVLPGFSAAPEFAF